MPSQPVRLSQGEVMEETGVRQIKQQNLPTNQPTKEINKETKPTNQPDRLVDLVVRPRVRIPLAPGFFRGRVIPVTQKLALQWLPCQAPGVIGSALGLVGPVSVYCDWVR